MNDFRIKLSTFFTAWFDLKTKMIDFYEKSYYIDHLKSVLLFQNPSPAKAGSPLEGRIFILYNMVPVLGTELSPLQGGQRGVLISDIQ
jgi:hypothetical protein